MSQSWDSVASMHDHLLTVHIYVVHAQTYPAWARLSNGTVRMRRWKRLQRPHPLAKQAAPTKCAMATFSLCSNVATGVLTGMNRPRLSLRSRLGGQRQRLLSRPFETRGAFAPIVRSTMRLQLQLWPEALRPLFFVHTLLLCAHGPTVLTNPEPCSAARSQQPDASKTRIHALM